MKNCKMFGQGGVSAKNNGHEVRSYDLHESLNGCL